MKLHTHVHHGKKPYMCDTCNKSYTSVSGLKTHWKTHGPCKGGDDEARLATIKKKFAASAICSHGHPHTEQPPPATPGESILTMSSDWYLWFPFVYSFAPQSYERP